MIFGNWLWPLRRRQLFSAASASLKIMASAVLFETSLGTHGAVAHRGERAFNDVRGAQMLPVLGREVVEAEQRVAILDQALDCLVVFDAPGLDEGVEGCKRILLGLGHPDFLQRALVFRLLAVRQLVEDIGGRVHPAALAARLGPYLFDCLPESERAIGDREFGANRQPQTGLHVNAVDPEVDVAFGREIAFAPAYVLLAPGLRSAAGHAARGSAVVLCQCRRSRPFGHSSKRFRSNWIAHSAT